MKNELNENVKSSIRKDIIPELAEYIINAAESQDRILQSLFVAYDYLCGATGFAQDSSHIQEDKDEIRSILFEFGLLEGVL